MKIIKSLAFLSVLFFATFAIATYAKTYLIEGDIIQIEDDYLGASPILKVVQGGTGAASFTAGKCLYGNGTDAIYADDCAAGSMTALPLGNIYVGDATNAAEATSSLYITSAGNVGIGTTAPVSILEADGVITATGGNSTNWNTAYGWGNHAGLYDVLGQATSTLASHTTTYNHDNYDTAYGWGNHAGLYDVLGQATSTLAGHTSTYNHTNYDTAYGWGNHAGLYLPIGGGVVTGSTTITSTLTLTGALTVGAYTLPNTDGTNGYVLKTDGSGALTWQEDLNNVLGSTVTLYHWNQSSNIAGYEMLMSYPAGGTEVTETGTSTAGSYGLIDPYISSTTNIIVDTISAGLWSFHYFANVDSNVGDTRLVAKVYEYATTSVETEIFTATSSEMTTGLKEYDFNGIISTSYDFQTGSRIVVKVYTWTDSVVERTVTFYYDGTNNYSHIVTNLDLGVEGYARVRSNETITGLWTFDNQLKFDTFDTAPQIYADADTNTGMLFNGPDTMCLMTGGTSRIHINSSGYIGINDDTPSYMLDVAGDTNITGTATTTNLTVVTNSKLGTVISGTWNGTVIGTQYGGTGQNFSSSNGMLFLNAGSMSAVATSTVAGNGLTFVGTTLNFDGGDSPAGELGGTWASPTVDAGIFDDEYIKISSYNSTTTHTTLADLPALRRYFSLTISTSTQDYVGNFLVAGATSTVRMYTPYPQTIDYLGYVTSTGTAGINMGDGTNFSGYKSAGTSFASSTLSTNNSFIQGETWDFQVNLSGASTVLNINGQLTTN